MKIIFDFDDVLFDSKSFKFKFFNSLLKYKVSEELLMDLYINHRKNFNPNIVYEKALKICGVKIGEEEFKNLLDELFSDLDKYIDQRMVNLIQDFGKENCFILTAGDKNFQEKKIKSSLNEGVVIESHIIFVKENKREELMDICKKYPNEQIIFVDDKEKHIQEAVSLELSNLIPILYDRNGFEALSQKIKELSHI